MSPPPAPHDLRDRGRVSPRRRLRRAGALASRGKSAPEKRHGVVIAADTGSERTVREARTRGVRRDWTVSDEIAMAAYEFAESCATRASCRPAQRTRQTGARPKNVATTMRPPVAAIIGYGLEFSEICQSSSPALPPVPGSRARMISTCTRRSRRNALAYGASAKPRARNPGLAFDLACGIIRGGTKSEEICGALTSCPRARPCR